MLMPGMLIMGCISSIQKYALKVSLPNNLFGYASIVDISDPYNLLLKRYTENCVTDDTQQQVCKYLTNDVQFLILGNIVNTAKYLKSKY